MKILSIIKKNFKLIIRSRLSALIILFGPLLIMLIVGLAFNSQAALRINVGYYSPQYNNLTVSFIDVLQQSNYNVRAFDSPDDCRNAILAGTTHICVVFPADFQVSNERVNEVVFLVDNSKINFFEKVVDSIETDFNTRALQLTEGMTQELLDKLNETQGSIANKTSVVYLLKEENRVLREDVATIASEVEGLDLTFNAASFRLTDLNDATQDLSGSITSLKNTAQDALNTAEDLIEEIDDDITEMNLSDVDRAAIVLSLNSTRKDLLSIEKDINRTRSTNTSSITKLIDNLRANLANVETRFKTASDARDVSVEKIAAINVKLNQSLAKIIVVENTFNSIYTSIQRTSVTDLSSITKPITKRMESVVTDENQLNFFFPYLVVLVIMFIGLLLSSTLMIMEKTSQAYFRNFVTPTNDFAFVFGAYLTTMVIMMIQLGIILALFALYFHKDILTNLRATLFVLFLLTTFFSFVGMVLGNLFNSEETGTLASISLSSILLFVSDLIFPLERMPEYVATLARNYNPFVIGSELLRKVLVHRMDPASLGRDLMIMVMYILVFFVLLILVHKFTKRTFILRWSGYIARRELRKQQEADDDAEMYHIYRNLPEKDHYHSKDKKRVGNLQEIAKFVEAMDKETFKEYVHDEENEFADWAENVLKNEALTKMLRKATSKGSCVRAIRKGIRMYDKLETRQAKLSKKVINTLHSS